jgi:hypothetical protein
VEPGPELEPRPDAALALASPPTLFFSTYLKLIKIFQGRRENILTVFPFF